MNNKNNNNNNNNNDDDDNYNYNDNNNSNNNNNNKIDDAISAAGRVPAVSSVCVDTSEWREAAARNSTARVFKRCVRAHV